MGASGWGSVRRGTGDSGDPRGWTVAEATASPSRPPTCSPTQSGHCRSSGSEWIQRAGLRVPPSFSFQCICKRISNSFTFNQSRLPASLAPDPPSPRLATPRGACPPHGREIKSPDSWSTAQNYKLPFGEDGLDAPLCPLKLS